MTLHTEGFESLADGTAISSTNTAFDVVSGTATFVADDGDIVAPFTGSRTGDLSLTSAVNKYCEVQFTSGEADAGLRVFFRYVGSRPTGGDHWIFGGGSGNSTDLEARVRTDGSVQLRTGFTARVSSGVTLSADTWYSLDITTDGTTFQCDIYSPAGSTTPVETISTTTSVPTTIDRIATIHKANGATSLDVVFDDITIAEGESLPARGLAITPSLASQLVAATDPSVEAQESSNIFPATAEYDLYDNIYNDAYPGGVQGTMPEVQEPSVTLTPTAASQLVSSSNPSLELDQSVDPAVISQLASSSDPTVTAGSSLTPASIDNLVVSFAPAFEGSVVAGLVSQIVSSNDPTVAIGEVFIEPSFVGSYVVALTPTMSGTAIELLSPETGRFFRNLDSGILALVYGASRSATVGFSGSETWEVVSGSFRFQWDTRSDVMAAVVSAYDANKTANAATLAAALDAALNNAGYRASDGSLVAYDVPVGTMT